MIFSDKQCKDFIDNMVEVYTKDDITLLKPISYKYLKRMELSFGNGRVTKKRLTKMFKTCKYTGKTCIIYFISRLLEITRLLGFNHYGYEVDSSYTDEYQQLEQVSKDLAKSLGIPI